MPLQLTDIEARILGSLVEKSLATPDQYPLSVNALTNACNQKTSREPVMSLEEAVVGKSLYPLIEKGLIEQRFDLGSRVPKFMHHVEKMLKDQNPKVVAAACVLLLRGPQTPGEIKGRTERLCQFISTAEVEALLKELAAREDPIVSPLPRQPGHKEIRWQHLFTGAVPAPAASTAPASVAVPVQAAAPPAALDAPAPADRLARLEKRVEALETLVKTLEERSRQTA